MLYARNNNMMMGMMRMCMSMGMMMCAYNRSLAS